MKKVDFDPDAENWKVESSEGLGWDTLTLDECIARMLTESDAVSENFSREDISTRCMEMGYFSAGGITIYWETNLDEATL